MQRIFFGGMLLFVSYCIFSDAWWALPRMLLGHNRAIYGTYRGTLTENGGKFNDKPGTPIEVTVTLHPSLWETPMTSHGHHFGSLFPAHDELGGTMEMQQPDGTVAQYRVHGHERDPGDPDQLLGLGYGAETYISLPMEIGGGTLTFSNLQSLTYKDYRTYAGTLRKQ